jgi:hypothetical protein
LSLLKRYCDDETAPYRDSMRGTDTRVRPDVRERVHRRRLAGVLGAVRSADEDDMHCQ